MCLIITGPAAKVRDTLLHTEGLLADIYKTNPDGIGVMFASRRGLRIHKSLPKSVSSARHFLTRLPQDERNLAVHFRWTTHGHTNKDNCHPYTIVEGKAAMMHNGVLRTGNAADRSRSDTWHFIEDYLKKSVELAPMIVHDNGYKLLVKDFIGSNNRFVFMTEDGSMSVINASQGVEHDGMWFSNTYAWTPGILIESRRSTYGGSSYQGGSFRGGHHPYANGFVDDEADAWDSVYGGYRMGGAQSGTTKSDDGRTTTGVVIHQGGTTTEARRQKAWTFTKEDEAEEAAWRAAVANSRRPVGWQAAGTEGGAGEPKKDPPIWTASTSNNVIPLAAPMKYTMETVLEQADVDTLAAWLSTHVIQTVHLLFNCFVPFPTKWTDRRSLDSEYTEVYDMCLSHERIKLIEYCRRGPNSITRAAECMCYYLDWMDFYSGMRRMKDIRNTKPEPAPAPQRQVTVVNGTKVADTPADDDSSEGYAG